MAIGPEPQGCALHPIATLIAGLICAAIWVAAFPALGWLCRTIDHFLK